MNVSTSVLYLAKDHVKILLKEVHPVWQWRIVCKSVFKRLTFLFESR
jgi:hypothetical protein